MPRLTPSLASVCRRYRGELTNATLLLSLAAIIGKPITFGREIAVAQTFGANTVVDFVILAQIIPALFAGLISGGAVLSLPALARRRDDTQRPNIPEARTYAARILRYQAFALCLGVVVAGPLLLIHAPIELSLLVLVLAFLSAQAWCDSASAMYAQLLQIDGRFRRAALQFALNGAVAALIIVSLGPLIGILAWPLGMLVDSLWQVLFLHRGFPKVHNPVARPKISLRDLLVSFGPALILFAFTMLYGLTDRFASVIAGAGILALWTWALRVGTTATGLAATPVATAVFSRSHSRPDRESLLYGGALYFAVGLALLFFGAYLLVGPQVIRFLFGGGQVSDGNVDHLIALCRLAVIAGVPLAVFTVTSRACAAQGHFAVSTKAFVVGGMLYPIIIALTFTHFGYLSLGIAYVLAMTITAVLSLIATTRRSWVAFPTWSELRQGT